MTPPPITAHDEYVRRARLLRVVDGDTQHLTVDLGYRRYSDEAVRLLGIDTPEINSGNDEEKTRGRAARDFVIFWYDEAQQQGAQRMADDPRWPLHLRSYKSDNFGRWLGEITNAHGESLADALLSVGLAVKWQGRSA